jgi:hypothetical protein
MSEKIEYFVVATGKVIPEMSHDFFLMGGIVYQDNGASFESQSRCVSFSDFIEERPDIGWRVAAALSHKEKAE